jgi:hypothetical protein
MERKLDRLRIERFGHFVGILNAIENHVEEGDGDPAVVRLLGEALLALAAVDGIPEGTVKYLAETLGQLHSHIAARRERRGR